MPGSAIERWMPLYDFSERHGRDVLAPVEAVGRALRTVDLASSPVVRVLFATRGLLRPGRRRFAIADFVAMGFTLLEDAPGEEIVLGLTGRFWRLDGALVRLTPEEFAVFARPGFVQAAWNFHVAPQPQGCRLTTETRVRATDERARRAFARYWRLVGPMSGFVRERMLARVAGEAERRAGTPRLPT